MLGDLLQAVHNGAAGMSTPPFQPVLKQSCSFRTWCDGVTLSVTADHCYTYVFAAAHRANDTPSPAHSAVCRNRWRTAPLKYFTEKHMAETELAPLSSLAWHAY